MELKNHFWTQADKMAIILVKVGIAQIIIVNQYIALSSSLNQSVFVAFENSNVIKLANYLL